MKNKIYITIAFILISIPLFASEESIRTTVIKNGIGFGNALAIAISYNKNKSILWAIIQGLFGWLYVIYFFFTREKEPW